MVTLPKESRFLPLSNLVKKCLKKKGKNSLNILKSFDVEIDFLGKKSSWVIATLFL